MKKHTCFFAAALFAVSPVFTAFSAPVSPRFDITSPFRIWLLNNEAAAMSSIGADTYLIEKTMEPFALMPKKAQPEGLAEENLWTVHRKFYELLSEIQDIYSKVRRYGNGRFTILFKQYRPELWSIYPFPVQGLTACIAPHLRSIYHLNLMAALDLDPDKDSDLSGRLTDAVKKLTDDEKRMLYAYFEAFSALYPGNSTAKVMLVFIENGAKQKLSAGMKDLLKPSFVITLPAAVAVAGPSSDDEISDPLAELERLIGIADGETFDEAVTETPSETSAPDEAADKPVNEPTDSETVSSEASEEKPVESSSSDTAKQELNENTSDKPAAAEKEYDPFAIWD